MADSSSEAFSIGPVKVSYGSLITSILGALTVLPVSTAIVLLFLKSERKETVRGEQPVKTRSKGNRRVINSDTAAHETEVEEENKSWLKRFRLPYWCQYIGWVILILSVLTAGLFIVFYAMDWGKEKSEAWLLAFFLSFFETILFLQPLKVLVGGLVFALLLKKDYDSMDTHCIRVRQLHDSGGEASLFLNPFLNILLRCAIYSSFQRNLCFSKTFWILRRATSTSKRQNRRP